METIDAFYFAIEKIYELKEENIEVKITPYRKVSEEEKQDLIKEYSGPERIPFDKWCKITFTINKDDDVRKIQEVGNYLGMVGISFDTGGCKRQRDWEFDWSFSYIPKSEKFEWIQAREDVEDMISKMNDLSG